jgi:membrane associated rhomboid family serine protease
VVTLALVGLNLVAFAVELSLGTELAPFVRRWGLVPADVLDGGAAAFITVWTSAFLHVGWLHLAFNLLYLGVFGPPVERRLGPGRFLVLYLACGAAGGLAYVLAQPAATVPALGASSAVAGLIAAHLVLYPGATLGSIAPVLFFRVVESTPTVLLLVLWLVIQAFTGVAALTTTSGVAWWAHLGGFASGLALAPLLRKRRTAG